MSVVNGPRGTNGRAEKMDSKECCERLDRGALEKRGRDKCENERLFGKDVESS